MLITRTSPFSGIERVVEINITGDQYLRWKNGELIQNVMPNLTLDEIEFLMTGIWGDEWDEIFGEKE
jgi:hypothetical protein